MSHQFNAAHLTSSEDDARLNGYYAALLIGVVMAFVAALAVATLRLGFPQRVTARCVSDPVSGDRVSAADHRSRDRR